MVVGDARVFPGLLTPVLYNFSFQSHLLLFSHASVEVRGENMPERKFASGHVSDTLTTVNSKCFTSSHKFRFVALRNFLLFTNLTASTV